MPELSDDTIDRLATAIVNKSRGADGCEGCRYNEKEAEWVHTGAKYVPSDKFPLLGKMLKMLDESAYELGKWMLKILFVCGIGGLVVFILHKFGVFK